MPDRLTSEQRFRSMSRNKGKDTSIELLLRSALHRRGMRFRKHVKGLPGRPDVVFTRARIAVFVDGDFWHGYRFKRWSAKLKPFWYDKIVTNRRRDCKNFRALRSLRWKVVKVWEHQIEKDLPSQSNRIWEMWQKKK